jgi:drug/metabolite transporter (DMT)-like permease
MKKGIILAIIATLISGWAVFINKFALANWGNSDIYTTEKNIVAALLLSSVFFGYNYRNRLTSLDRSGWFKLFIIALIGGSIPFILFFKGLSLSSSSGAAFWNKTLFIWVAILAIPILKEKFTKIQLGALIVLIMGNLALFWPKTLVLNASAILILMATVLWALEYVLAKKFMSDISPEILAWGRTFIGSIFLLLYIVFTHAGSPMINITLAQIPWLLIVGLTLTFYIFTWYKTLGKIPSTYAAAILTVASPTTTLLEKYFGSGKLPQHFFVYFIIIIIAISIIIINSRPKTLDQTITI